MVARSDGGSTLTVVKVRNPSGYSNEVGIENQEVNAHVSTSLRSTPTDIVNDPVLISLLNLTTFQGQAVFFYPERRQTGA